MSCQELGFYLARWCLQGSNFLGSTYFTKLMQSLKRGGCPSSKHESSKYIQRVQTALRGASHYGNKPEFQRWVISTENIFAERTGVRLLSSHCVNAVWSRYSTYRVYGSHKYFVTGGNLLRCWDFTPSFFKKLCLALCVFSCFPALLSLTVLWGSVGTPESWEGRRRDGEGTLCYTFLH